MKFGISMFIVLFLNLAIINTASAMPKDFFCPKKGESRTKSDMYQAMQKSFVWNYSSGPIIFVDNDQDIEKSDLVNTYFQNGRDFDTRGVFKIGYFYEAKECRRQIVLEDQIEEGVYSGHLAIEVCDPQIASLFMASDTQDLEDVFIKAPNLRSKLEISASQSQAVSYYYQGGKILPRFKLKLNRIEFTETSDQCQLFTDIADEANYYAGVASDYTFLLPYDEALEGQSYLSDTDRGPVYKTPWETSAPLSPIAGNSDDDEDEVTKIIRDQDYLRNFTANQGSAEDIIHYEHLPALFARYDVLEEFLSKDADYRDSYYSYEEKDIFNGQQTYVSIPPGIYNCQKGNYQVFKCRVGNNNTFSKLGGSQRHHGSFFLSSVEGYTVLVGVTDYPNGSTNPQGLKKYSALRGAPPTFSLNGGDATDAFFILTRGESGVYYLHSMAYGWNVGDIKIWN